MLYRILTALMALGIAMAGAQAHDESKYPDWQGQWIRREAGTFDPTKPAGLPQQPPLTPEYQAVFEKSVADQAAGGQGNNPMGRCIPPGMPRMMIVYGLGVEIVITPTITYMLFGEPMDQVRRIYTDGRAFPEHVDPSFSGFSIGQWEDTDGDGRYDTLTIETRFIKNPRSYDSSGMPFHKDGKTVVKERIFLDKANPNVMRNQVTVTDSALTRPFGVTRTYRRERNPSWVETICGEDEHQVKIGNESYFVSGEGELMPTRKGQPAPSLKHFGAARP